MAKNVLIVDDAAPLRQSLLRSHRRAGIDPAEAMANRGDHGIEVEACGRHELVLGDLAGSTPVQRAVDTFVK